MATEATDGVADEAQGGEADGGGHFADLPVFAFVELDFDPRCGDVGPIADWGCSLPRWSEIVREQFGPCWARVEDLAFGLQLHGALQCSKVFFRRKAFNLDMIGLPNFSSVVSFKDAALEAVVVGQQEQAFRVAIKPSDGVDIGWEIAQVTQSRMARFWRELAEGAKGLYDGVGGHGVCRWAACDGVGECKSPFWCCLHLI